MNIPQHTQPTQPWWRIRMMWLVVGGPALVVVAGFATLTLAIRGGDRPIAAHAAAEAESHTPAMQARNHVVTPRR
jgi:hypothetical protein